MSQQILNYVSPANQEPSLRLKKKYLLPEQTLSGVSSVLSTKAVNKSFYVDQSFFEYPNVFFVLDVEIDDNTVLTDADYIEIAAKSGVEIDVNGKLVNGAIVTGIGYEADSYSGKRINVTDIVDKTMYTLDTVYADETAGSLKGKLRIVKDSFAYDEDENNNPFFFVRKYIAFQVQNTSAIKPANIGKNTAIDNFYGLEITPFGAFVNNANVKISVSFYAPMLKPAHVMGSIYGGMEGFN